MLSSNCVYAQTPLWQVWDPDKYKPAGNVFTRWQESLGRIASYQMGFGKELLLSRPYFTRIPDQTLVNEAYDHLERITATRDTDRTYAFIYTERGKAIDADLTKIGTGPQLRAWWFDPRSGRSIDLGLADMPDRDLLLDNFEYPVGYVAVLHYTGELLGHRSVNIDRNRCRSMAA